MVKSKVRFDGMDVAAMAAHLNRVALGRRVINIYNGPNGETYLFKLDKQSTSASTTAGGAASSSTNEATSNLMVLLESGIRFHTTNETYENPGMPSPFCSKLRKHLRGLRLEAVQQLGQMDRVILMTFGSGAAQRHYLILELYAKGNLLLTNSDYIILSLLRSHDYDGAVKVQVGHAYPVTYATTTTTVVAAATTEATQTESESSSAEAAPDDQTTVPQEDILSTQNPYQWFQKQRQSFQPEPTETTTTKKKKGGTNPMDLWKSMLLKPGSGVSHYGPALIDHCLLRANITKQTQPCDLDENEWKHFQSILRTEGDTILNALNLADSKGYIIYQPRPKSNDNNDDIHKLQSSLFEDKLLLEFQPHLLQQHEGLKTMEYDSFNGAVDAFFAHIESQKRLLRAETQQIQAEQRLEKIRLDQEQRLEQLIQQQELLRQQAELVEAHAEMVENAIQVVNSALDNGMGWDQLDDLIQMEKTQNQNPVAMLIHKLELEQDAMVLRLQRLDHNDDNDDDIDKTMDVTISLKDTAYGNASALFAKYRSSKEKGQKTMEANQKALQAAEENAQRQLQEAQKRKTHLTSNLHTKRKPLWFEKFHWFITTDNYLAIAGRDAQQNELIVKRYLRAGDAYLHADVHGAASCVLRAKRHRLSNGKTQSLPISEQALREAGNFTICRSSAWASRIVTSAWWVESHQVSKTAPSGEYLTVGSFMIRGRKNFLPPTPLELGLGILFQLGDDEAIARHKNDRRDFALMQLEDLDALGTEPAEDSIEEPAMPLAKKFTPPLDEEHSLLQGEKEPDQTTSTMNAPRPPTSSSTSDRPPASNHPSDVSEDATEEKGQDEDGGDEDGLDDTMSENGSSVTSSVRQRKGLSVKERKLIRKYGSLEAAQAAEEERKKAEMAKQAKEHAKPQSEPAPVVAKRGKKTKMKKIAKKYVDQDEEDRELAMLALHAGEKEKKKDKKVEPQISEEAKEAAAQTIAILKKDASVVAATLPAEAQEALAKCVTVKAQSPEEPDVVRWDKFDADVLEQLQTFETEEQILAAAKRLLVLKESTRIDNFSASLAGIIRTIRKYGHEGLETEANGETQESRRKTRAEKENEQEAWKKTLADEGVMDDDLDDDAIDDTIELNKLTGKPHDDDLILAVVPVCAPYQTLSQYTYRIKLTPGNMKRGKAAKACLDLFYKEGQKGSLRERDKSLIKKVADNEWVAAIAGDVKISAAGASKAIQKQKAKKQQNKKK